MRVRSILPSMAHRPAGEGTLRKRKNGSGNTIWEWRPPKSCPIQRGQYAKSQKEVLKKRDIFLREIGAGVTQDASKLTVSDFLVMWLRDSVRPSVRGATLAHHERMSRNHLEPRLGNLKLRELTGAHVASLYADKLDAGFSDGTRRHVRTTLNKALKQAVRWGYLVRNPAEGVPVPKAPQSENEDEDEPGMRALSAEEALALLRASRGDRYAALYSLALATGMRQGEMLALPWKNVDLATGIVRVRRTLVIVKGGFEFAPPKTGRSRRDVELRPEAILALREHRKRQLEERMRFGGAPEDHGLVFATTTGTPVRRQNLQRRHFKPLLVEAGLRDIRFHDLRHTFATLTLSNGADLNTISKMMGHSSIKTTLDCYAHIMPGQQGRALNSLNGLFG